MIQKRKYVVLIIGLQLLFWVAQAQPGFNCDEVFLNYYKFPIIQPISNMQNFCHGAEDAFYAKSLALKWEGNIEDVSSCTRYSYEKHNVEIVFMGNDLSAEQLDYMAGHNFVMIDKIKQQLGSKYDELGNFGPMYFGPENIFTETFYTGFNNNLTITKEGNNHIHIKLENAHVFPAFMSKIKIEDKDNGQQFSFADLEKGISLDVTGKNKTDKIKFLRFLLDDFNEPFYCKASSLPNAFLVWVDLNKVF